MFKVFLTRDGSTIIYMSGKKLIKPASEVRCANQPSNSVLQCTAMLVSTLQNSISFGHVGRPTLFTLGLGFLEQLGR